MYIFILVIGNNVFSLYFFKKYNEVFFIKGCLIIISLFCKIYIILKYIWLKVGGIFEKKIFFNNFLFLILWNRDGVYIYNNS